MKAFAGALLALALGWVAASDVVAQDRTTLSGDRDKVSYMVGMDVARSLQAIRQDIDMAAFERAVRHAADGGEPLLQESEARETGQALMQAVAARRGQPVPGLAPGTQPEPPAKDKVGLLVGADVGRSLAPIKEELDLAVVMRALRTVLAGQDPILTESEAGLVRNAFSQRMQARMQAKMAAAGEKNKAEGAAFLAGNKQAKGVFSTPSGLQYMVLRQGNGPRPKRSDRVRVNYRGTLLDGTVFDSSYDRGEPAVFQLGGVIAGWQEGLALMPVGAKYRFWIPGELGYGASGTPDGSIGPNATLVFDVELLDVLDPSESQRPFSANPSS